MSEISGATTPRNTLSETRMPGAGAPRKTFLQARRRHVVNSPMAGTRLETAYGIISAASKAANGASAILWDTSTGLPTPPDAEPASRADGRPEPPSPQPAPMVQPAAGEAAPSSTSPPPPSAPWRPGTEGTSPPAERGQRQQQTPEPPGPPPLLTTEGQGTKRAKPEDPRPTPRAQHARASDPDTLLTQALPGLPRDPASAVVVVPAYRIVPIFPRASRKHPATTAAKRLAGTESPAPLPSTGPVGASAAHTAVVPPPAALPHAFVFAAAPTPSPGGPDGSSTATSLGLPLSLSSPTAPPPPPAPSASRGSKKNGKHRPDTALAHPATPYPPPDTTPLHPKIPRPHKDTRDVCEARSRSHSTSSSPP